MDYCRNYFAFLRRRRFRIMASHCRSIYLVLLYIGTLGIHFLYRNSSDFVWLCSSWQQEEIAKYRHITVDKIKIFDELKESVDKVGWIPFEVWLDDRTIYSSQFNRQDSRKK